MSRKTMNFKSLSSLDSVKRVINEADSALKNPNSNIKDSPLSAVLAGALGGGIGGVGSFAALYGLGTVGLSAAGITSGLASAGALVGGGMVAGIFVLAAPIVVVSGVGVWYATKCNNKRLLQAKERILQDAIRARDAIISALNSSVEQSKDHIDHLTSINIMLQKAVQELQADLAA